MRVLARDTATRTQFREPASSEPRMAERLGRNSIPLLRLTFCLSIAWQLAPQTAKISWRRPEAESFRARTAARLGMFALAAACWIWQSIRGTQASASLLDRKSTRLN